MKVLVINCGSSSLKYQLFDMDNEEVMVKGLVEILLFRVSATTANVQAWRCRSGQADRKHTEPFRGHCVGSRAKKLRQRRHHPVRQACQTDGKQRFGGHQ